MTPIILMSSRFLNLLSCDDLSAYAVTRHAVFHLHLISESQIHRLLVGWLPLAIALLFSVVLLPCDNCAII